MRSTSIRLLLVLLPLALVAGVALWLTLDDRETSAREVVGQGSAEAEPDEEDLEETLVPVAVVEDDGGSAPRREVVEASAVAEEVSDTSAETGEGTAVLFSGTIVLLGDGGARVEGLSGVLKLTLWGETSGRGERVEVDGGRFELVARVGEDGAVESLKGGRKYPAPIDELRCVCESFQVEGRGAMLFCDPESRETMREEPSFPAGTLDVALTVRPAPGVTLHVLDAASGGPLTGVEVRASRRSRNARLATPQGAGAEVLVQGEASPVAILPTERLAGRGGVTLFVRAESYAWKTLTIDMREPVERTVELSPGGALDVTIQGEAPRKAVLRLRQRSRGTPLSEIELRGKTDVRLESLPPGTYSLKVELGPWYSEPIELGGESVEVLAGSSATVTIPIEELEAAQSADIAGEFILPVEWGDERPQLSLERLTASKTGAKKYMMIRDGELSAIDGNPGRFRFQRKSLETGRYELSYGSFDAKLIFELPPEGRPDLVFEVAPPVDITVRVVDLDTGLDAPDVETIHWHVKWPEGASGGTLESASRDPDTGLFACRVPRGPIDVSCFGLVDGNLSIPLATDGLQARLEVRRRATASVELRCGDEVVPWPSQEGWDVEPVDGEGSYNSSGTADGTRWFGVTEPGRYRVTIPAIDGFLPHEPVEVDLVRGERQSVVVELVRK
ncbi:MAG: hypothetical protein AAGB93_04535 [Planctomycetota bacterium]